MKDLRECPTCRALLTLDRLVDAGGSCPYCGTQVLEQLGSDFEDPFGAPGKAGGPLSPVLEVPREFGGKVRLALRLQVGLLPLIAALVLTIWAPGQLLVRLAMVGNENPADPLATQRLSNLVGLVFGPIYTGGILTALAFRMSGRRLTYREAISAGLHHWARLLGARVVAGLVIFLGLLALVVPGIILGVRYCLVDEVVVLEGCGVMASRHRSSQLAQGRGVPLFLACTFSFSLILIVSIAVGTLLDHLGVLANPAVSACYECLIEIVAVFFTCFLFLFYWEARGEERYWSERAALLRDPRDPPPSRDPSSDPPWPT